ncbi:MAG: undecaprenyl-diphosphate phosphatase [Alysiella sp.]|uniref:undecaprenyl-diphosphate phosphatase n=1 Tax=Alysiella sp. TaxID=1872483 RepID=UPI0026DC82A1|nr:undecaprenyl-diphosphate phosphatase [Alysiella sp.]MDO4433002.1 undecaprenyl-diphosphate phosphatase [Alysiella sp.]
MDFILIFKALLMGVIEGLTEFLPISSTGHLIVFGSLLDFRGKENVFEIAIQLGAILAVLSEYRQRFAHVFKNIGKDPIVNRFVLNLAVAFVPAAVVGLLLGKHIEKLLFNPISVAAALVVGGLLIIWIEKRAQYQTIKVQRVDDMRMRDALAVGVAQILALIPGTSRSGSTIMGGMWWGIERKAATEFSFFLAVPMMIAATAYKLLKHHDAFTRDDLGLIVVGLVAAFFSALLAVKALLRFVASRNYLPFAYYRIAFGGVILLSYYLDWVKWD